jgi:hypothetical protein
MYKIILLLIMLSGVEITAMKRSASVALVPLLEEVITPQLEQAVALIAQYRNPISEGNLSDALEKIFCTSPLFEYVTKSAADMRFQGENGFNCMPVLNEIE